MKVGKRGQALIKHYEKLRLKAYKPHKDDVWTIGWGHTKGVKEGDVCTPEQAEKWFKEDLAWVERAVNQAGALSQSQYDAVASLVYNIGGENFRTSTLKRKLKERKFADCDAEILKWRKSSGRILKGLRRRRAKELVLFLED